MRADLFQTDDDGARPEVANHRQAPGFGRYELDVLGSDVADVVDSAGGWLFDRVMAGWSVNVAVPDDADVRPLQILGVSTSPLEALLRGEHLSRGSAIALAGPLCSTHEKVREALVAAVRAGRSEITVWGELWVTGLPQRGEQVRHQLSSAAATFKAQAMHAAGCAPARGASFESFRSHGGSCRTDHPDLVPIG